MKDLWVIRGSQWGKDYFLVNLLRKKWTFKEERIFHASRMTAGKENTSPVGN